MKYGAELCTNITVKLNHLVACGRGNSKNKIIRISTIKRLSENNKITTLGSINNCKMKTTTSFPRNLKRQHPWSSRILLPNTAITFFLLSLSVVGLNSVQRQQCTSVSITANQNQVRQTGLFLWFSVRFHFSKKK